MTLGGEKTKLGELFKTAETRLCCRYKKISLKSTVKKFSNV